MCVGVAIQEGFSRAGESSWRRTGVDVDVDLRGRRSLGFSRYERTSGAVGEGGPAGLGTGGMRGRGWCQAC